MVEGWVFSALLVAFLAFTTPFESFYLLGSYMHTYRQDEVIGAKQLKNVNEQICQICGDTVGFSATGDIFVCNECAFPVCRSCYEYERKEGNQCCPQCKSRYKRHKGSPRVGEMRRMELMIWTMNETIHKAMSKGLSAAAGTRGRC